jgi:hypothetical protein
MTLVYKLNPQGIEYFKKYLDTLKEKPGATPPLEILTDPNYSEAFQDRVKIENLEFENRIHMIEYLSKTLDSLNTSVGLENNGLWSWLSLYYFDQVCPINLEGNRIPGMSYRHILEKGYRYQHRHLLAGPFSTHKMYGANSHLLLNGPPHQESQIHHEICARQGFITNRGIIEVANILYFSTKTNKPKPGVLSKTRAGSLLRLIDVIQQLELTYDLYSMKAEEIMHLLPEEFNLWKDLEPASN